LKVLLVDDESALLEKLAQGARRAGYKTSTALSGEAAWERLGEERFDILVTDLRMPGMDGPSLMARLPELNRAAPRVIVITGYATLETAVECLRKGAADFLKKPFAMGEFLLALERVSRRPLAAHPEPDWEKVSQRYSLTHREVEILKAFFITGKSNRELAENLFVSYHTVKSHLKSSFMKMNVDSRSRLMSLLRDF
jgi:FixJ family two-component response regulator